MIIFDGYLTGKANEHFWKRDRDLLQKILLITFALMLPAPLSFSVMKQSYFLIILYCAAFVWIYLLTWIPKSKKKKETLVPYKIVVSEDELIYTSSCKKDIRSVSDAKELLDYGEFYEIVFPMGKQSSCFICQKELITSGTVDEFESLFQAIPIRRMK